MKSFIKESSLEIRFNGLEFQMEKSKPWVRISPCDSLTKFITWIIENLANYFPDYEYNYVPKKYYWDIFSTLNRNQLKFIDHAIKEINKQKVTQESTIKISAEIMDQIIKKHFYSRKKEEHYLCLFQAEKFIRLIEKERKNINLIK